MKLFNYIYFGLFSVIFGCLEAYVYSHGFVGGDYVLFGHFSWYHILASMLFLTFVLGTYLMLIIASKYSILHRLIIFYFVDLAVEAIKYLLLCTLLEDITYWIIKGLSGGQTGGLNESSWVLHGLGWLWFMPVTYWIAIIGIAGIELWQWRRR